MQFDEFVRIQVLDEEAVRGGDPVFAGHALENLPDFQAAAAGGEHLRGGQVEVGRADEQDLVRRGGQQIAVLGRFDIGQLHGKRRLFELVAALVVVVELAAGRQDPHDVVGVDGDLAGETGAAGVGFDFFRRLEVAVDFVAREPDAALPVRLEVIARAGAQPAETLRLPGEGVVVADALRRTEPDQPVLVLRDVHGGQGRDAGASQRRVRAAEIVAVEAGQAVTRADPDEAEAVLISAVDGVGGEAFVGGEMAEVVVRCGLNRPGEQADKQQEGE